MKATQELVSFKLGYESIEGQKPVTEALRASYDPFNWLWTVFNYLSVSAHIITWTLAKSLRGGLDRFIAWLEAV